MTITSYLALSMNRKSTRYLTFFGNDHCVCMQAPQERLLGRRIVQKSHKIKSEEDRCYYIPLIDMLKQLGKMEVMKEHVRITAYPNTHTYVHTCTLHLTIVQ